jgi:hypothetical protein
MRVLPRHGRKSQIGLGSDGGSWVQYFDAYESRTMSDWRALIAAAALLSLCSGKGISLVRMAPGTFSKDSDLSS